MSIFRSEEMAYQHIAMQKESAYEILNFLGEANAIQFVDMNENEPLYHRAFSKDVKRCEEIEAKLQQIQKEMVKRGIPITHTPNISQFLKNLNLYISQREQPEYTYIDEVEAEVKERSQQLQDQTLYLENLKDQRNQLFEQRAVLQQCKIIIADNNYFGDEKNEDEEGFQFQTTLGLNYICGTILTEEATRFKKIVFRATKGNNWTITNAMKYQESEQGEFDLDLQRDISELPSKTIFMIVYSAGSNNYTSSKLNKICDVFQAQRFGLPSGQQGFIKKIAEIDVQIKEIEKLIHLTESKVKQLLYYWSLKRGQKLPNDIGATQNCSYIEELRLFTAKEKQIWIQMNYLDYKSSIYNGYFWCPTSELSYVANHLKGLQKRKPHLPQSSIETYEIPKHITPPTHFKINQFTAPFQEIVNTYGIPRYGEINPGFFAVAMFPFKFGVMFGDIGHGGLLLAAGIVLCLKKDALQGGGLQGIVDARYLLLLMGVFACYCGFIYNDFFSLTTNFFGSCFELEDEEGEEGLTKPIEGCVYPFGLDPKWYIASNELAFFNSLKMKLAVIIGVSQMLWGVILKGWNAVYFRNWLDFIFEFIPQVIFMVVTFGYMDFLIIYKWNQDFTGPESIKAPSIINQMINLPLKAGSTEGFPLWDVESQESLQYYILIISLLAVPTMLLPKPLILLLQNLGSGSQAHSSSSSKKSKEALLANDDLQLGQELENSKKELQSSHASAGHGGHGGHGDHFDFGEIFVHQIIETIEFVLGAISNTASYLRLWALSLAHSQLARVFFEKTIGGGIVESSVISTLIGWVLFANITLCVIMGMDFMECFLHALRLQWVEFQGKFFKADGYKFIPFSFQNSLKDTQEVIISETGVSTQ